MHMSLLGYKNIFNTLLYYRIMERQHKQNKWSCNFMVISAGVVTPAGDAWVPHELSNGVHLTSLPTTNSILLFYEEKKQ